MSVSVDNPADITVCVCTFNRADSLLNALRSLFAQETDDAFRFDIVVVNDGSTDDTADVLRQATPSSPVPLHSVYQANSGVGSARNRSVAEAKGKWVAFFDDDEIAPPRWLFELHRVAKETGAECVGGPCLLKIPDDYTPEPVGTTRALLGENPFLVRQPGRFAGLDPRRRFTFVPSTCNSLVKRTVFNRLGGFQVGVRYGEDLQLFRKLKRAGVHIEAAPDAVIFQVVPESRLELAYLLPLASKGARCQLALDCQELGKLRLAPFAFLRSVHLVAWTLPSMMIAYLGNRPDVLLAKRCSLRFGMTYLAGFVGCVAERFPNEM